MGMQQILLITLSVVIVGLSIAVGIHMFNYQARNNNRQNIISDMHYIASEAIAHYRTPAAMGGGEGVWDEEILYSWIIIPKNKNGNRFVTENGEIRLKVNNTGQKITLTGFGNEIGFDEEKGIKARLILKGPNADPRLKLLN